MRILFVYAGLGQLGGIETLISRLSRRLHTLGHEIVLLLQESRSGATQDPTLLEETRRYADVRFSRGWFRATPAALRALNIGQFDAIYAFDSNSLLLALVIQQEISPGARVATGAYHTREYVSYSRRKRYRQRLVEDVMRAAPVENVFFMSADSAREHGDGLGRDFSKSPIVPIAIDTAKFKNVCRSPDRRKIVSVGRLTDFKTYNLWMLEVCRELNRTESRFEYHIYGTGETRASVERKIAEYDLGGCVFLRGNLPYSEFGDAMKDAFLFVGMGTAALEAAACGVPTLIAIDSCPEPVTFGLLPDVPGRNVGERAPHLPTRPALEVIEELAQRTPPEYDALCEESRLSAERFSVESVADDLVNALRNARHFSYPIDRSVRLKDEWDLWLWRVLRRVGVENPYDRRYLHRQ